MATRNGRHLREKAIAAILQTPNVVEASLASGVPERTLHRWIKTDEEFKAQLEEAKRSLVESAVNQLRLSIRGCVDVLVELAQDRSQPGAVRCSAARAVISLTLEVTSLVEIENRLKILEGARVINQTPTWNQHEVSSPPESSE
jgi:hypothetical protein